uniref:Uncharacterized protein n=1 Tax=Rhizophora mucronata TaxID=61149 RepID=A0A2P2KMC7_RHIMU
MFFTNLKNTMLSYVCEDGVPCVS